MALTNGINGMNGFAEDSRICDYSEFLSIESKRRFESSLTVDSRTKDSIFVSTGLPNPDTFPLTETRLTLKDGTHLHLTENKIKEVLQYGPTAGDPAFRTWLVELQRRLHNPPTLDGRGRPSSMDLIVNTGCSQGISEVMSAILDDGDTVLTEEYTFATFFNIVVPLGANIIPVISDEHGILASKLEIILSTWNEKKNGKFPKVLYSISSVSNPTSTTCSLARKREIYRIAHEYNILILEDDPYFMLQFHKPSVPSFLSLDVDGRVIRLDSFAKILSAGARLGYISGPKQFLEKILQDMSTTVVSASNISQAVIFEILLHMGHDGFIKHGEKTRDFYERKAIKANQLATKHLTGLAEWLMPRGGMFLWIKLLRIEDSSRVVDRAAKRGVMFTPGKYFTYNKPVSNYIRASFALVSAEQLDQAFTVLAEAIKAEENI